MRISDGSSDVCSSDLELALLLDYALVGSGLGGTPVQGDDAVVEVEADAQRLTQALRTLLDFAIARDGQAPGIATHSGDGRAHLRATLRGPAPPAEEAAALLEQPDRKSPRLNSSHQ